MRGEMMKRQMLDVLISEHLSFSVVPGQTDADHGNEK